MPVPIGYRWSQESIDRRRATMLANGKKRIKPLWCESWLRAKTLELKTSRAIARHVGCNKKTVLEAWERFGITPPPTPKNRRQTAAKRKRAIELYLSGLSLRVVATAIGGVDATTIEDWVREDGHVLRGSNRQYRMTANSARTERGRRRLQVTRDAVRLQMHEGMGRLRTSRALSVSQRVIQNVLATPYAEALRLFVYGSGGYGSMKPKHARAMNEQGVDVGTIARTLSVDDDVVVEWLKPRVDALP